MDSELSDDKVLEGKEHPALHKAAGAIKKTANTGSSILGLVLLVTFTLFVFLALVGVFLAHPGQQ